MTHLVITRWDADGRINKFQDRLSLAEAEAIRNILVGTDQEPGPFPQAFVVAHPTGGEDLQGQDYIAAPVAKTITLNPLPPPPKPTAISYEAFQDRFAALEMDAVTKFADAVDTATGDPKRPRLKQALARAWAKNTVNLADARTVAFMDALVAGGVVTAARRDAILTP